MYFCKMNNTKSTDTGKLIKTARHLRGLSMDDLCHLIGGCVSKQTISNYERGKSIPNRYFLDLIQSALCLPSHFFSESQPILDDVELRYHGKLPVKELIKLKTIIQTSVSRYLHLETMLGLDNKYGNPLVADTIACNNDVEFAASKLRDQWRLGDNAIPYLCSQLEYRGVRIIEIDFGDLSFDGMSGIIKHLEQPFIAINKNSTIERRRFTVTHELGHILLNLSDTIENKEKPCNYFAGAFLFPRSAIEYELGECRKSITMEELISIKERYGISIAAIVHRAYDLGIIDRRYYDHLYDDWINKNRMETGWGEYKISDIPRRYEQLKARAISEGIVEGEKEEVEITIL